MRCSCTSTLWWGKDWEAACSTRTQSEQRTLAEIGSGSCAETLGAAIEQRAKESPASASTIEDAQVGRVKVTGDRAAIELLLPPKYRNRTLDATAVKDGDRWALIGD